MSDESLFREVDEEVRREQVKKLWNRYGTLLVAVSLAVIVGVAGWKGWQYWQLSRSQAAAKVYFDQGPPAAGRDDHLIARRSIFEIGACRLERDLFEIQADLVEFDS